MEKATGEDARMNNLIQARISPELISVLKEITDIMKQKGKRTTKYTVCKKLVNHIKYGSNIMENIRNEK